MLIRSRILTSHTRKLAILDTLSFHWHDNLPNSSSFFSENIITPGTTPDGKLMMSLYYFVLRHQIKNQKLNLNWDDLNLTKPLNLVPGDHRALSFDREQLKAELFRDQKCNINICNLFTNKKRICSLGVAFSFEHFERHQEAAKKKFFSPWKDVKQKTMFHWLEQLPFKADFFLSTATCQKLWT